MIAERRGLAFAALGLRPLDAFDRVMADRVFVAQISVINIKPEGEGPATF
jgi:hypothetical protein